MMRARIEKRDIIDHFLLERKSATRSCGTFMCIIFSGVYSFETHACIYAPSFWLHRRIPGVAKEHGRRKTA